MEHHITADTGSELHNPGDEGSANRGTSLIQMPCLQIALLLVNLGTEADLVSSGSLQSIAVPTGQTMP